MSHTNGIQYGLRGIESWRLAEAANDAPLRVLDADGSLHYSHLKTLARSGRQYLQAVNTAIDPTSAMLIGTAVHALVLGVRNGAKPLAVYPGKTRQGKAWEEFQAENDGAEILSVREWDQARRIAEAVCTDPIAIRRLEGARLEVPLTWEENGIRCSTSGIDIVPTSSLGDLKTTPTVALDAWTRHAFRQMYPQQLAFYRRGARANGLDVSHGMFLLGVETKAPFEVVDLELSEEMIDFADRAVSLLLERLRVLMLSCPEPRTMRDWPGYAESPVLWELPSFLRSEDEDEADEEEAA